MTSVDEVQDMVRQGMQMNAPIAVPGVTRDNQKDFVQDLFKCMTEVVSKYANMTNGQQAATTPAPVPQPAAATPVVRQPTPPLPTIEETPEKETEVSSQKKKFKFFQKNVSRDCAATISTEHDLNSHLFSLFHLH